MAIEKKVAKKMSEEEAYDEDFFARQRKLLEEKDKFVSIEEI